MSAKANKAVVRRFYEACLDTGDLAAFDEVCAPDYLLHLPGNPGPLDREGAKRFLAYNRAAFPDLRHAIADLIAEGHRVAARFTMRGTHLGSF